MRRPARAATAVFLAMLLVPVAACGSGGDGITINVYYAPEQNFGTVVAECNQAAAGRYTVTYQVLPRGADDQRVQMARRLAAQDDGIDVLGLDITWTAEFASAEWVREWTGQNKAEAEADTLAGPLESARYDGRLWAAPKNTNVQLLWYRSDVVTQVPRTWAEMIRQAQELKAQGKPYQVITMGAQYEGLVVLYNTLTASAGGQILNEAGTEAVFDAGAVRGLEVLREFARAGITSPSFTNSLEDDARREFQAGQSAFQLNWPFVYPSMAKDAPDILARTKWARYPAVDPDRPSRVTLGGYNLAVSRYSKHPEEAFEVARCLRNREHQKYSALNDGVPPTIRSIYDDPELAKTYPMKDTILAELQDAANRPRTPAYQNVSTVLSASLSPPSEIQPERLANELRKSIQDALESKGVLP